MKLYENIVIGNFLYGLGFAVRAHQTAAVTVSTINLLSKLPQTPSWAICCWPFRASCGYWNSKRKTIAPTRKRNVIERLRWV